MEETDTITFEQAPDFIRARFPEIPTGSTVKRQRYKNGETIQFRGGDDGLPKLFIVESGVAEIFQTSNYQNRFHAYRPIKVFRSGDAFGLFSIADAITGRIGPARPKEDWTVRAGKISTLLLGCIHQDYCEQRKLSGRDGDGNFEIAFRPHHMLQEALQDERTEILEITLPPLESLRNTYHNLSSKIIEMSWLDVLDYRLGKNIYNLSHYRKCRQLVYDHPDYKELIKRATLANTKARYKIRDVFVDAVIDALDRPTYDAPMFKPAGLTGIVNQDTNEGRVYTTDLSCLYDAEHTRHITEGKFYYPIGLLNYDINLHVTKEKLEESLMKNLLAPAKKKERGISSISYIKEFYKIVKEVYFDAHSLEFKCEYLYDVEMNTEFVSDWNFPGGTAACQALLLEFNRR